MNHIVWVCVFFTLWNRTFAKENSLIFFPDSFEVVEDFGRPQISVRESGNQIVARIAFETSWESSKNIIRQRLGENYFDYEAIRMNVLPVGIDLTSEFLSNENPSLLSSTQTLLMNQVLLDFRFNKDYSISQIREAIYFPISYGTVDAEISCEGTIVHNDCKKVVKRIPLINRYSQRYDDQINLRKNHYSFLRNWAAHRIIARESFLSPAFSDLVKRQYWPGGCQTVSLVWHLEACEITEIYSDSGSIGDAVNELAQDIFPKEVLLLNQDYFVRNGSTLGIRRLNLAIDFHQIAKKLNNDFVIFGSEVLNLNIPLVSNTILESKTTFTLNGDFLSWKSQKIHLSSGNHLNFKAILRLKFLGISYEVPLKVSAVVGMNYDPVAQNSEIEQLYLEGLEVESPESALGGVIQRNRDALEDAINIYLSGTAQKKRFERDISDFLVKLQQDEIGFNPIL